MIKKITIFLTTLLCWTGLAAREYTPATVPNVQLTDARRCVSNPEGILSASTVREIDRMCADLKARGLAELVVLVLDEVDEGSLDMFAHNVLNLWGVGQKGKNNGMVISVVRRQGDIQFEVGYGLEGVLPDALCKRIQQVYMVGPLGDGEWDKGVLDGVTAVYNVLTDNQEELGALRAAEEDEPSWMIGVIIFFVGMIVVASLLARHDKKNGGGRGDSDSFGGGIPLWPFLGGFGAGGGFGGGRGGGFGGGGFGGGFGGGMSGGGGARSGF
jgi:uncharacterized protein